MRRFSRAGCEDCGFHGRPRIDRFAEMQLPTRSDGDECGRSIGRFAVPIARRIRDALNVFSHQIRGFVTDEAVLVCVESRTSSPVRIPRDPETLENPQLSGLYPVGEGAGYAGGIVSAALDGIRAAQNLVQRFGRG